jgi:anti-sigma B factor antagonist
MRTELAPQTRALPVTGSIRLSVSPSSTKKDVFILRVDGSVDTLTADELDMVIGTLVRQDRNRLVIDLGGATYVSSAGWGIFISRLREVREGGGDLKLARMVPVVRDVYDLLELDGVLLHFDHLDAAEAHFNGGNGHGRAPHAAARPVTLETPMVEDVSRLAETTEMALRNLILEDPFYSIGELQGRLAETSGRRVGRWAILVTLWRSGFLRRSRRFRYFRSQQQGRSLGR